MVVQYPHKLTATIISGSVQDSDGNWVPGSEESREIVCRAEPNGITAKLITLSDGRQYAYEWVVYMPKGTTPIPEGTKVIINCSPSAAGNVMQFSMGQLNSRLWL